MRTRRDVLKTTLGTVAALAVPAPVAHALSTASTAPKGAQGSLAPTAFRMLPLGQVKPSGWLRRQLRVQADGLGGHLDEFWPDVGSQSGWLGGTGESWERGPYFLDGLLPLAYLLDDEVLKAKARRFVEWTLTHQASDGMIGPPTNDDWWPRMVMTKALAQWYDVSGDRRVLEVLTRYCHHQLSELPRRPLKDWGKYRWQDQVMVAEWLYERTRDPKLLELCALLKQQGFDWTGSFQNFTLTEPVTRTVLGWTPHGFERAEMAMQAHGVNNGQALKTAAVQYRLSGDPNEKQHFDQQLSKLDHFHGQPSGMFSCDEHLAGTDPSHGTELCTVVETMFSLETALATFGDPLTADRLEKIAFNALPGTFTEDMWAHQYDGQANQIQVGLNSKPWTTNGPESNLYGLEPNYGCCTANFHQGWPKFTTSLWMATHDEGLVAALYAPCEVNTVVRNTPVRISEETDYPFRGSIRLTLMPSRPVQFPLSVRVPAWVEAAEVLVNGNPVEQARPRGSFLRLDRLWTHGDTVVVRLPMQPRMSRWFHGAVALERGPLVFSLSPGESWVKLRDRGLTADWQVFPTTSWNYALSTSETTAPQLRVVERPVPAYPFAREASAVEIHVPARQLAEWKSTDGVADPVPSGPVESAEVEQILTFVPYGSAKLRVTAFPQLRAREGKE